MLSEKSSRILSALVHNQKTPLSAKKLAELLEMSERSVCSYLKEVRQFCEELGIEFISKTGVGICLNIGMEQERKIEEYIKQEKPYYSAEYRKWYIICLLLNNWTSYTLSLFADDLGISKTTVNNDLNQTKEWLSSHEINVVSKPGSGIALEGKELNIRSALVEANRAFHITRRSGDLKRPSDYRLDEYTMDRLISTYKISDLKEYISLISLYEKMANRVLTGDSFVMVLEYMLVQLRRSKSGHYVTIPAEVLELKINDTAADKIVARMLQNDMIPDHAEEKLYLSLLIYSADCQYNADNWNVEPNTIIKDLANQIIQYTSDLTGIDLKNDRQLQNNVFAFLGPSVIRACCGFRLANPLLQQVKEKYPSIFSVCYAAGRFYNEIISRYPTESELSYLALLIGGAAYRSNKAVTAVMVCAAGTGAAQLITMRLRDELPSLHIAAILPFSQSAKISEYAPQLIISTSPLFNHDIQTVYVSALVNSDDVRRLRRACNNIHAKRDPVEHVTLRQLLWPELIYLDKPLISIEKVIRFAADQLEKNGFVDNKFYANTMEREQIASTALGKGIAIPHSTSGRVKKPAVCLIRLDKSIDWGGEAVDIIFVLALDFVDIGTTGAFFKVFYNIISDDETVEGLRHAGSIQEIQRIITERCEF